MPPPDTLLAFLGIALLVTVAPGPDNLMVLGLALARGPGAGLRFGIGCALGCFTHILWASLGVGAALAASPTAFATLRLAGAAYLAWLGFKMLSSGGPAAAPAQGRGGLHETARGFLANALNPKVALFFLAFIPQFVDARGGSAGLQVLVLGLVFVAQTVVVFGAVALAAGRLGALLRRRPRLARWLDRLAGALFIALALRLALA